MSIFNDICIFIEKHNWIFSGIGGVILAESLKLIMKKNKNEKMEKIRKGNMKMAGIWIDFYKVGTEIRSSLMKIDVDGLEIKIKGTEYREDLSQYLCWESIAAKRNENHLDYFFKSRTFHNERHFKGVTELSFDNIDNGDNYDEYTGSFVNINREQSERLFDTDNGRLNGRRIETNDYPLYKISRRNLVRKYLDVYRQQAAREIPIV